MNGKHELDGAEIVGVVDGEELAGVFDGPQWVPHFGNFNAEISEKKIGALKGKAITRKQIAGKLATATTFGERRYFLDVVVKSDKKAVRVELPTHRPLWKALNGVKIGAMVQIEYQGLGPAKQGQNAPHLYSVKPEKGGVLDTPRSMVVAFRGAQRSTLTGGEGAQYPDEDYGQDVEA